MYGDDSEVEAFLYRLNFIEGVLRLRDASYPTSGIPVGLICLDELYEFYEAYVARIVEIVFPMSCEADWLAGEEIPSEWLSGDLSGEELELVRERLYFVIQVELPEGVPDGALEPVKAALKAFRDRLEATSWGEPVTVAGAELVGGAICIVIDLLDVNPSQLVCGLLDLGKAVGKACARQRSPSLRAIPTQKSNASRTG